MAKACEGTHYTDTLTGKKCFFKSEKVPYKFFNYPDVPSHSDSKAITYMHADNKIAEGSTWIYGKLDASIANIELQGFDVSLTAFEGTELKEVKTKAQGKKEIKEDDFDPNKEIEPICKKGDIWQLGEHRLMCGDSVSKGDVELLMDGQLANMVFTDPPYGVEYVSRVDKNRRKPWGNIINDDLENEKLRNFLYDSLNGLECPKYVCCNWQSVIDFMLSLGKPNSFIVWDKGSIGLGKGYRNQHEIILFYGKLNHDNESNVWTIKRDSTSSYKHPTQKPVNVPSRAIQNSTLKDERVLDLFGGSGSTLIACEQLDRKCYMMELDPHYCDVIINRWEEFTGQKAELKK